MSDDKRFWGVMVGDAEIQARVYVGDVVPVGHVYPNAMTSRRDEIGICDKSWHAAPIAEVYEFWQGNRTLVKIKGQDGFYLVRATEIKKDET